MIVDKRDARVGDRVEISLDQLYSCRVIERINDSIRLDFMNTYTQHKRDQWINLKNVMACFRSDMPKEVINIITRTLKNKL